MIDDQIDLLNVHHRLRGFLGIPELGDGTSDIDATAEEIAATQATLLAAAPAFRLVNSCFSLILTVWRIADLLCAVLWISDLGQFNLYSTS